MWSGNFPTSHLQKKQHKFVGTYLDITIFGPYLTFLRVQSFLKGTLNLSNFSIIFTTIFNPEPNWCNVYWNEKFWKHLLKLRFSEKPTKLWKISSKQFLIRLIISYPLIISSKTILLHWPYFSVWLWRHFVNFWVTIEVSKLLFT